MILTPIMAEPALELTPLMRRHPHGSGVVSLSAPGYPRAESAVVYYHYLSHRGGLIRLERSHDKWSIAATTGWRE